MTHAAWYILSFNEAWLQTLGRLHVVVVHFPLTLLLLAGVVEGWRAIRRKPTASKFAVICLVLGVISAAAAVAMGWIHKGFEHYSGEAETALLWHQWMGIATLVVAILAMLAIATRKVTVDRLNFYRAGTVLVALMIGVTGHFGGTLTHGPGYLTELLLNPQPRQLASASTTQPSGGSALSIPVIPISQVKYPADGKIDFMRDVRPILVAECYDCHGPDAHKGGLRLDGKEAAFQGGNSGSLVVPGHPEASLLMKRVNGQGGKQMPLGMSPLAPEHVKILSQWIQQGAVWPDGASNPAIVNAPHWAYLKPIRPNMPQVKDTSWPINAIDYFTLAKMEAENLKPSPEADRITLIRRLSLDLIGLPPTPEEVDAFVNDQDVNAYEKVVDRLLASPHYGERWGRHWLDIARYADTNGYEKDRTRSIWAYRDWVINAMNKDLPYDQFIIDQLAGDMLPNATPDQIIATGFHRNTMFNEEGGIDVEEFRFKSIVDRVQTTSTAFLGLTMHCAQCHNHKYDKISQKEYYQFFSMLNNADEPDYDVPVPSIKKARDEAQAKLAKLVADLPTKFPAYDETPIYTTLVPENFRSQNGTVLDLQADKSLLASGAVPKTETYRLDAEADLTNASSIRLEVLTDPSLPKTGPGRFENGNFVLSEIKVKFVPAAGGPAKPIAFSGATADFNQDGFPVTSAIDGKADTGWGIFIPAGGFNLNREANFMLKDAPAGKGTLHITLEQNHPSHSLGHFRLSIGRKPAPPKSDLPIVQQREKFLDQKLAEWEKANTPKAVKWTVLDPSKYTRYHDATITRLPDKSLLFTGDSFYREQYQLEYNTDLKNITAVRVEVLPHEDLPNNGPGRNYGGGFRISEFTALRLPEDADGPPAPLALVNPTASVSGDSIALAIDGKKDSHWTVGGGGNPAVAVFKFKNKLANNNGSRLQFLIDSNFFDPESPGRVRISVTDDAREGLAASSMPADVEEALLTPAAQRTDMQKTALRNQFLATSPLMAGPNAEIAQAKAAIPQYPTTLVMKERAVPRITHIHKRGEYLQELEPVTGGVPAVLPQLPKDKPANRLTLAQWITDPENPLPSRVIMNRTWNYFFGRGIVNTIDDFGVMGEKPSHPELLDWLATEFIRQHWSMKTMHKLIVMSATYRQSSKVDPELLEKDPANVLMARGPRLRVDSEIVRDVALASAGLLSNKIGGPSVFPPQPPGVEALSYGPIQWIPSQGEDRYRRGMYTFMKRTALYPGQTVFDSPTADVTCTRRIRSNTPLQALTTLNDTVFVEAAQAMANKLMTQGPKDPIGRAKLAFRLCTARQPEAKELGSILEFYDAQKKRFEDKEVDAAQVALPDPSKPPKDMDLPELAAWTTVSRVMLNLDETLTRE